MKGDPVTDSEGYPHHLVGDPAPPPAPVDRRVLGMALKAHARHLAAVDHELRTAGNYRRAYSLDQLVAEANAADPGRNTASDGWIGDARHQAENGPNGPGSGSDHNPWVKLGALGIVRAEDITNDPALGLAAVAERIRAAARAGRLPQVTGGGYVILNGRITAADWSGWHVYNGADPHVSHMHVSVSLAAALFDSRSRWGVFTSEQPAPAPTPAPSGWTGPDLTGSGASLRGQAAGQPQGPQSNGPRVAALQDWLRTRYSLYAKGIKVDGWFGTQTAGVLAEFARRSGIKGADGLNIGPQLAAALTEAGFERDARLAAPYERISGADPEPAPVPQDDLRSDARSGARARVLGHLNRRARR